MPRSKTPARTRRREREPLTSARIAEAALALIDAEGLDACSMRRLGAALGVEAMALYHHLRTKGELLDAVMDLMLDEMRMPPRGTASALERLRTMMRSYWEVAVRHPRAFVLLAARRFNTERAFGLYEEVLEAFADVGLDAERSAYWFRLIGGFASGAGMAYAASAEMLPDATRLRLQHDPEAIAHPHVRAVAPYLQLRNLDAVYEFGAERLFTLLAQEVAGARRRGAGAPARGVRPSRPARRARL